MSATLQAHDAEVRWSVGITGQTSQDTLIHLLLSGLGNQDNGIKDNYGKPIVHCKIKLY